MKYALLIPLLHLLHVSNAYAQAAPVKNTSCGEQTPVIAVPNGNGFFFSKDCKTAFVLPPVHAHAALNSIADTYNLPQCDEWNSINRGAAILSAQIDSILAELNKGSTLSEQTAISAGPVGGGPFPGVARPLPHAPTQTLTPEMRVRLKEVTQALSDLRELRSNFDGVVGATAHFTYELNTQALVAAYQKANPSIHFEALPLSSAYLTFEPADRTDALKLNPLLSMSVPGLGKLPALPDYSDLKPSGQKVEPAATPAVDLKYTRIFGASLSGNMILSLSGACPYYDSSSQKMPKSLSEDNLTAYLQANLQYTYSLQAFRSYKAEYNLAAFVKRLLESKTEGGFFSSQTVVSFINEEKTSDWFKYESTSNDSRFFYPYIVQEIKGELIKRVLAQITKAKVGGPVEDTGLASPKPDGASRAAENLHKCPDFYCQAAGFVLDVADSVFRIDICNEYFHFEQRLLVA